MRIHPLFRAGWLLTALMAMGVGAEGGGITADVGLTPSVDRWIFRSQLRYMERGDDPADVGRTMEAYGMPIVLASGLRPNVTVIARQVALRRRMEMMGGSNTESGPGDFTLLSKWKLIRVN